MNKKVIILLVNLLLCTAFACAQEAMKSELHRRAEAFEQKKDFESARSLYVRALDDYGNKDQLQLGVECAVKATALYYKANQYNEAFELLRYTDQAIHARNMSASAKAALHYLTTKERLQMYMRMRRNPSAQEQLNRLEYFANLASNESLNNDLLYSKAIFYYTFGQNAQGNAVFQEMATKLTAEKEYDKVDEVYKKLIANGRRSGNAQMVAQSYDNYIAWKDSANAQKVADEINALKRQISDGEAVIVEKEESLSTRKMIIIGLCFLVVALIAALVAGGLVLMRYILLTRKQKKTIQLANESNALKAKFISNISAQLNPTFQKLDSSKPEVHALLDFAKHIQTLSELENSPQLEEVEEVAIHPFCNSLMDQIRDKVKTGVTLTVNSPKMDAMIHKDKVSHILLHLLNNAAEFTPEGGAISLDFKKRGPHSCQVLVSDTGKGIPSEMSEDVFKPFLQIRDLTNGDGLGLPICKQMALKMNGDLVIDTQYTRGTRFVLDLHV